jgi:GNAT superfamily N-acetyltransferase
VTRGGTGGRRGATHGMMVNMDLRLRRHLAHWLGQWPATGPVSVVGSPRRERPGWDGGVHPLIGVAGGPGCVLSVPPDRVGKVRELIGAGRPADEWLADMPEAIGLPDRTVYSGVFRWTARPEPLPDAGTWVDAGDPSVPEWLRIFGGQVLLALDPDTGGYLAGVGIKRHDQYGHEIAVGTEQAARGKGLARRLVAQAARRILDEGAIPTYQHAFDNVASARVAQAAGFPDRGWTSIAVD